MLLLIIQPRQIHLADGIGIQLVLEHLAEADLECFLTHRSLLVVIQDGIQMGGTTARGHCLVSTVEHEPRYLINAQL